MCFGHLKRCTKLSAFPTWQKAAISLLKMPVSRIVSASNSGNGEINYNIYFTKNQVSVIPDSLGADVSFCTPVSHMGRPFKVFLNSEGSCNSCFTWFQVPALLLSCTTAYAMHNTLTLPLLVQALKYIAAPHARPM
jgi:hypothetical protein